MNPLRLWILLPITSLLCSCAVFAPDHRPSNFEALNFSLYSDSTADATNRWWETFQSLELNTLVDEALTNAPSIHQAWARLDQAQALAVKAGAARFPSVGVDGSATTRKDSLTYETSESYSLGLNASYELDLWGRIHSATKAAALDRDASREQLHTVAITLSSQVALNWMGMVSQQLQTERIQQQLEANQTSLELMELRFRKSQATALDVYQQRQTVAATESRIPPAELREALLRNSLTALLGRTDFQSLNLSSTNLPTLGPLPAVGIPADVLANRPDVRRAGLRLQAADWSVSAARADRLPAIRLTASADYTNIQSSNLFNDWYANLIGSITGPIFEGGRRKAEVKRTRSVAEERLADYRETVINAMKEVEDALVSEQKQHRYIEALDRNVQLSRNSYNEAFNRYRTGLSQYLPVLVELVQLQSLERDRIAAQYNLLQYRINLYRALGGTWPNELQPPSFEREDS
jgi:outer membrane protein, multidrug efflux system